MATGSIYALAALGFTLLWQASGTINFAQGEFVMLPAFMMLILLHHGASLWLALRADGGGRRGGAGVAASSAARSIRCSRFGMMPIVVATIGLSIALRNGVRAAYSAEPQPFPQLFPDRVFELAGVVLSPTDIGTFALAVALVVGTQMFLARTVTGRAMQAVAQNTESARGAGHQRAADDLLHLRDQRAARHRRRAAR